MRFGRTAKIAAALLVLGVAALGIWLATFDVNRYKPEILSAVKQATGRDLVLDGPLRLRLLPQLALRVRGARFANAPWGTRPDMIRVDDFAIRVALLPLLRGQLRVRRVELDGADILLERNAEGRGNWQLSLRAPSGPAERAGKERPTESRPKGAMPTPHLEELLVRNAKVAYHDARTGQNGRLSLDHLRVTTDDPGAPLDLGLDIAGAVNEVAFALEGRVGALEKLTPAPGESYPVDLTLRLGDALSAHAKGGLREPLLGRGISLVFQLDSGDLARVGRAFGRELPIAGPLELSASVTDPQPRHYLVNDLVVRLAAGDVTGSVDADLRGARPALALDLSSQAFDPAKLRAPAEKARGSEKEGGSEAKKQARRLIPDSPLPFDALRRAPDTNLRWRVERLTAGGATLSRMDLTARLRDGELSLHPLAAELAGGRLDADLALVSSTKSSSLRLDAKDVVLGDLLAALGAGSLLERGPTDLSLELRGSGDSLHDAAAGASGRLVLAAHDATLDARLLDRLGPAAAELLRGLLGGDSRIPLRCGITRFDVRGGVATSRVLLLDAPRVALVGSGKIELAREKPDLVLWARTHTAAAEASVARIRVVGSLARPRFEPDAVSTALSAAETFGSKKLRERIGELAPLLGGEGAPRLLSCDEALAVASGRAEPEAAPVGEPTSRERAAESLRRGIEGLLGR
jgi:uncharacterized protein involved in outer membrane biogenesis